MNQNPLAEDKSLPSSQPTSLKKQCQKFLKQGLNQLNQGNYAAALAEFQQALQINPHFIEAYICQSIIHYYQGDYQNAIADCNQVLQINSRNADAYNNRGLNQIALGDYQAAIADFNQVLKIEPNHAKAYLNRGYCRLQLDDNWGSIEDFDQALRLDPPAAKVYLKQLAETLNNEPEEIKESNQQLVQGLLIQGNLRYESGDYQEAIQAYNQVLSLDPNNTEAYNRRSTVRSALGDYEGAFADFYKAANYYLDDPQVQVTSKSTIQVIDENYHQRGMNKLQEGDFPGAIASFNQVLQLNIKDAVALACRGFAYRRLGDNQKAIEDLQQAAQLFSEQGNLKSAQHILDTLKKF